jgi:hypothetical protein
MIAWIGTTHNFAGICKFGARDGVSGLETTARERAGTHAKMPTAYPAAPPRKKGVEFANSIV